MSLITFDETSVINDEEACVYLYEHIAIHWGMIPNINLRYDEAATENVYEELLEMYVDDIYERTKELYLEHEDALLSPEIINYSEVEDDVDTETLERCWEVWDDIELQERSNILADFNYNYSQFLLKYSFIYKDEDKIINYPQREVW